MTKLSFSEKLRERNCNASCKHISWVVKTNRVLHLLKSLEVNNFMLVRLLPAIRLLSTAAAGRRGNAAGGYVAATAVSDLL